MKIQAAPVCEVWQAQLQRRQRGDDERLHEPVAAARQHQQRRAAAPRAGRALDRCSPAARAPPSVQPRPPTAAVAIGGVNRI